MSEIRKAWKRGDMTIRDGKVLRFIEEELEGEKWEIVGALTAPSEYEEGLEAAVKTVLDNFKKSEAQGYRSRDRQYAIDILERSLIASPARGERAFAAVASINEDAGTTDIIFEDTGYVAKPLLSNVYHWIDLHHAMDDDRIVGVTIWATKPPSGDRESIVADDLCECPRCGRMHRHLGMPPGALYRDDFQRLSRAFNVAGDLRVTQDYRINEWLKGQIAAAPERDDHLPNQTTDSGAGGC